MNHLWVLSSTLVLSTALVVSGVAAGATTQSDPSAQAASAPVAAGSGIVATSIPATGFYWQLTTPQQVLSGTFLTAIKKEQRASDGTRSDKQFFEISRTGDNDVPEAALRAYRRAEKAMTSADPDCNISWTLLAAIGRVESDHGRFAGSQLGSDGVSRPEIRGPQLNGAGPFAAIRDSDNGVLDLDRTWDRAVGQMQFLPETWRSVARDGDGDGEMNPQDIDDSALASAVYLCGVGGSVADTAGMSQAAFRYNHSDYYVSLVLSYQAGYQSGVFALPSPPPPTPAPGKAATVTRLPARATVPTAKLDRTEPGTTTEVRTPRPRQATPATPTRPSTTPKPKPTPRPKPSPATKPKPLPAVPKLVSVSGIWSACSSTFCLGGIALDLGLGNRGATANADFDNDGTIETNGNEFAGLAGQRVTLSAERRASGLVVYVIGNDGLRNQDGSFARTIVAPDEAP